MDRRTRFSGRALCGALVTCTLIGCGLNTEGGGDLSPPGSVEAARPIAGSAGASGKAGNDAGTGGSGKGGAGSGGALTGGTAGEATGGTAGDGGSTGGIAGEGTGGSTGGQGGDGGTSTGGTAGENTGGSAGEATGGSAGDGGTGTGGSTGGQGGDGGSCVPTTETCDGLDQDCDNVPDNGVAPQTCYSGPPGTQDIGLCKGGTETCTNGSWSACDGQVLPAAEECDFADNNCDGTEDEGCMGVEIETDSCHAFILVDGNFNIIAADSSPDQATCWAGTKKFFVQPGYRLLIWDDDASETINMNVAPATVSVRSTSSADTSQATLLDDLQNGTFSSGAPEINITDLGNGYDAYTLTVSVGGPNHEWRLVF